MKKLMMIGGLMGFGIGLVFGLAQNSSWPSILWRSSVACLVSGLLLRWWGQVWVNNLHAAYQQQLAAASAQENTRSNPAQTN
ncbi:MAG: hypothetical protein SFY81_09110 [Verrucomicrobiota bacterium]|nr:hypothetical protein [Verrucomicrobiota bacterium]